MRQSTRMSYWTLPICIGACAALTGIIAIREFDRQIETVAAMSTQSEKPATESTAEPAVQTAPAASPFVVARQQLDAFSARLKAQLAAVSVAAQTPAVEPPATRAADPKTAILAADVFHRRARLAASSAAGSFEVREKIAGLVSAATRELVGGAAPVAAAGRPDASAQHRDDLNRLLDEIATSADLPRRLVLGLKGERTGVCLAANDPALFGKSFADSKLFAAAQAGSFAEGFDTINGELFWGAAAPLPSMHGDNMAVVLYGSPINDNTLLAWAGRLEIDAALFVAAVPGEFRLAHKASTASDAAVKWGELPAGLADRLSQKLTPTIPDAPIDARTMAANAIEIADYNDANGKRRATAFLALPGLNGQLTGVLAFASPAASAAATPAVGAAAVETAVQRAQAELASLAAVQQTLAESQPAVETHLSEPTAIAAVEPPQPFEQIAAGARQARQQVLYALGAAALVLVLSPFIGKNRRRNANQRLAEIAPREMAASKQAQANHHPETAASPDEEDKERSTIRVPAKSISPLSMLPGYSMLAGKSREIEEPAEEGEPVTGALQAVLSSRLLENRRILVAEDSRENNQLISHVLKKAGAELMIAENSRAALEAVRSQQFDSVLIDAELPGMDGAALIRSLRAEGYTGRIVGLAPQGATAARDDMIAAGGSDCLTKPLDYAKLIASLINQEASRATVKFSPDFTADVK